MSDFPSYAKLIEDIPRDPHALAVDDIGVPVVEPGLWRCQVGDDVLVLPTSLTTAEFLAVTNFDDAFRQTRAFFDLLPRSSQELVAGLSVSSGYYLALAYAAAAAHQTFGGLKFPGERPKRRSLLDALSDWAESLPKGD